ncbi:MAG: hypothetical protein H6R16_1626 [Proteobacteria bacterium]|nr:hypothetical protein [Pseudomonadota bacterium]
MGNGPQDNDDLQLRHGCQFGLQVGIALANFRRRWLVGRRQAAHGVSDAAISKLHRRIGPAVRAKRFRATGKSEAVQCRVEQLAGDVASKWTTGSIGSFFTRAEADDEQFSIQRAEGGNRQGMPVWVALTNGG